MRPQLPTARELTNAGKEISLNVFKSVKDFYERNRHSEKTKAGAHKDRNNLTYLIDKFAQDEVDHQIGKVAVLREHEVLILGEEKDKYPKSLEGCKTIVAFVDPIDGTDLVVRGFGNWCLAIIFFYPPERRIIASVIGHSSGEVYFATEEKVWKESFKMETDGPSQTQKTVQIPLARDAKVRIPVKNAGICFYGQKPKNFLAFTESKGMMTLLRRFRSRMAKGTTSKSKQINMRLYNFGGNPMMAKLANGDVDAVLGLFPQEVHDVLPGAHIATQAGAILTDLRGTPINLETKLMFPRERVTYILSASRKLHQELLPLVQKRSL